MNRKARDETNFKIIIIGPIRVCSYALFKLLFLYIYFNKVKSPENQQIQFNTLLDLEE